jgi:hypothetical protein
VPVHEHCDDAIFREMTADLQRCIQRLAHLDRVGADPLADPEPDAVDLRVRFRHRDDRERQPEVAEEHAARFPVPEMPRDEDDPAPLRTEIVEEGPLGLRHGKQAFRLFAGGG